MWKSKVKEAPARELQEESGEVPDWTMRTIMASETMMNTMKSEKTVK